MPETANFHVHSEKHSITLLAVDRTFLSLHVLAPRCLDCDITNLHTVDLPLLSMRSSSEVPLKFPEEPCVITRSIIHRTQGR